jgi:hypothetical protein
MYSKTLVALAAASLVNSAIASPHHGLRHVHPNKRGLVTEVVTVTDWVTVTVTEGDSTAFYTNSRKSKPQPSAEETTSSLAAPAPSPTEPTTTVVQVTSTSAEQNSPPVVVAAPSSSPPEVNESPPPSTTAQAEVVQQPPPPPPPSTTSEAAPAPVPVLEGNDNGGNGGDNGDNNGDNNGGGGGNAGVSKRGLAYNHPDLLDRFLSSGSKVSWAYNWGQRDDSGTDLEFCPMLWGLKLDFAQTWPDNAQSAIDAGSRCLFSFNEPDIEEQANMSPQLAAEKHIELMNPYSGKALIGSPAVSNSGASHQGLQWMQQWFDACGGRCAVDFVNIHIYGVDTNTFLAHLLKANEMFKKPVWITEFAFGGSEEEIDSQLATVIDQIETNATYSFVERYSYFMVENGFMVKGNSLSTYGNTFAYGA